MWSQVIGSRISGLICAWLKGRKSLRREKGEKILELATKIICETSAENRKEVLAQKLEKETNLYVKSYRYHPEYQILKIFIEMYFPKILDTFNSYFPNLSYAKQIPDSSMPTKFQGDDRYVITYDDTKDLKIDSETEIKFQERFFNALKKEMDNQDNFFKNLFFNATKIFK